MARQDRKCGIIKLDNTSFNLYNLSRDYVLEGVYYFVDEKGVNPVKEFIHSLPPKEQTKVYAYINELKIKGWNLRRPMADYLSEDIYELRPRYNRIFYFFYLGNRAILVHAIKKRSKEIPSGDLQLCIKRKMAIERDI